MATVKDIAEDLEQRLVCKCSPNKDNRAPASGHQWDCPVHREAWRIFNAYQRPGGKERK